LIYAQKVLRSASLPPLSTGSRPRCGSLRPSPIIHAQPPACGGGREAARESSEPNERHVYRKWTGRKIDRPGYASVGSWRACECLRHAQQPAMGCARAVGLVKLLSPWPPCRRVVLALLQAIAGHECRPTQSLRRCSIGDPKRTFFTNLEQDNRKENQAFFLEQTSAAPVPNRWRLFSFIGEQHDKPHYPVHDSHLRAPRRP
jgi:hypothetical protein